MTTESLTGPGTPGVEQTPRLEVRGLSKTFSGVTVLSDAHLSLAPGEIHGLVGQNGSGKSTLIKLISGVYKPDPGGDISIDGERIGPPIRADQLHLDGVSFVHQDLGLVNDLTVRENVRVGRHATRTFAKRIDKKADREATLKTFEFLGVDINPDVTVGSLQPSQRAAVAVARALQDREAGRGVIVFDESSRAIPHDALPEFYRDVRFISSQGTTVLMVSHNLKEVLDLCDRVTVLRNGQVVESGVPTGDLTQAELTRMILGREHALEDLIEAYPPHLTGEVVVSDVSGGLVQGVDFTTHKGEVLGIVGTPDDGSGYLPALLCGAQRGTGTITFDGRTVDLGSSSIKDIIDAGIAYVPEDRAARGLDVHMSVSDNITLPHLRTRGSALWTGIAWRRAETDAVITKYEVKTPSGKTTTSDLSGGNQQKILFGKWLLGKPTVLILEEPTQAVDVGARSALLHATREAAQEGAAVIYCSGEVDDLTAVCDRVLVLKHGRIAGEFTYPIDPDELLRAQFGTPEEDSHVE